MVGGQPRGGPTDQRDEFPNPPSRCSVIPGWGDERMGGVEDEALHKKLTGSFTDAPSGKACAPDLGVGVIILCGVEEFTDISSSA